MFYIADRNDPLIKNMITLRWAVIFLGILLLIPVGCAMRKNLPPVSKNNAIQPPGRAKDIPENVPPPTHGSNTGSTVGLQYRIGPEDVLRISVWGNKDLTLDLVVRPDGKISVPLIQDIQAEGLTAAELADLIKERLLAFIKEPHVTVVVLQVNSAKFYVVGEVKNPGTYFLRGYVSVLQALAMAQGFTEFASLRSIRIVRNIGGTQEVRVVSFYDIIDGGGEENYLILPGDTIVVP